MCFPELAVNNQWIRIIRNWCISTCISTYMLCEIYIACNLEQLCRNSLGKTLKFCCWNHAPCKAVLFRFAMCRRYVVKMRCGRDRKCKTREGSPATSYEMGLPAWGMHIPSLAAERRKKPREDPRHGTTSKWRELMRRTSPPTKRRKVIKVISSTSEEAEEYRHGHFMSERE